MRAWARMVLCHCPSALGSVLFSRAAWAAGTGASAAPHACTRLAQPCRSLRVFCMQPGWRGPAVGQDPAVHARPARGLAVGRAPLPPPQVGGVLASADGAPPAAQHARWGLKCSILHVGLLGLSRRRNRKQSRHTHNAQRSKGVPASACLPLVQVYLLSLPCSTREGGFPTSGTKVACAACLVCRQPNGFLVHVFPSAARARAAS